MSRFHLCGADAARVIYVTARWWGCRSRSELDDLIQDGWVGVLTHPDTPPNRSSWTAIRTAVIRQQRLRRQDRLHLRSERVDSQCHLVDLRFDTEPLLDRLPPYQREIVQLTYWEGLDDAEIADRLETTKGYVKATRYKAMVQLRRVAGGD